MVAHVYYLALIIEHVAFIIKCRAVKILTWKHQKAVYFPNWTLTPSSPDTPTIPRTCLVPLTSFHTVLAYGLPGIRKTANFGKDFPVQK